MRKLMILTLALVCFGAWAGSANAKQHIQNISKQSAEAFCGTHGGGTDCDFCDARHCHTITCAGKKCYNWVYLRPMPGGVRNPNGGTKVGVKGDGGGTKIHPVRIDSGLKPVAQSYSQHSSGGGMHQGGRH